MSMDPNIWVETLPKSKKNLKEENYDLNANKWINSIPKKRTNFSKIKYSFTILLFNPYPSSNLLGINASDSIPNEFKAFNRTNCRQL